MSTVKTKTAQDLALSADVTARARAVLAELDEGDRTCVRLCGLVPWCDLTGRATALGIIDGSGMRTDLGREVARLLADEDTP